MLHKGYLINRQFPTSRGSDRAAVVAVTVHQIIVEALRAWLRGDQVDFTATRTAVETLLRDEFGDIARQTRDEIRLND